VGREEGERILSYQQQLRNSGAFIGIVMATVIEKIEQVGRILGFRW
jgi:hypothetical protein